MLRIESEIGELVEVLIHEPGAEIEKMTPENAEIVLYNDIIPLSLVKKEYAQFKSFLSLVARTREITTLLAESLTEAEAKETFVRKVAQLAQEKPLHQRLQAMEIPELVEAVIHGLPFPREDLSSTLSEQSFLLAPIPNLYFTRDSSMTFGDRILSGAMASSIRSRESLITTTIYQNHPDFRGTDLLFNGFDFPNKAGSSNAVRLEGGDFLVLSKDTLVIGVSDRTSREAIDFLGRLIASKTGKTITIVAVLLPSLRSTIHLDMIFNLVDRDAALVFSPFVMGSRALDSYILRYGPQGSVEVSAPLSLLKNLKKLGTELHPILCGGTDPVFQQREQWLSGNNVFAYAPGKILGFGANERTLEVLHKSGFSVIPINEALTGLVDPKGPGRKIFTLEGIELARGGGGMRCMTMPLIRKSLE
jgi:arginine deiminase